MDKAIVMISGGLDSAVSLWWSREKGWELYGLTFNHYPIWHRKEVEAAEKLAKEAGVIEHAVIELPFLKEIQDRPFSHEHPLGTQARSIPPVYIPARNTIFYGIAAHWAEQVAARWIVGGHNLEDLNLFPDSTKEFFHRFNELLKVGTVISRIQPVEVIMPLSSMDKAEIIRLGSRFKVPFDLTWSCHGRGETHCGSCLGCRSRLEAFGKAGLTDPAGYQSQDMKPSG